MSEAFIHGVNVIEVNDGPRPIRTVRSSVIGLVGTAPGADADKFPLNTPVLIMGQPTSQEGENLLGEGGTLKNAVDGIVDQAGAMTVVVRVEAGRNPASTLTNIIGDSATKTGVHAFLASESVAKVTPRILIAPGFTGLRANDPDNEGQKLANPVVAEMLGIADRLRSVIIADGPNTTDADAISYAEDWGSDRVYVVDPHVKVSRGEGYVNEPASSRVAGLIAKSDNERGFWVSPSNQEMGGIAGTARPIDFGIGNTNSVANYLNEGKVATIIHKEGRRLWGNRSCASDPKWAFLSVRRTADMINESLLRAHMWAIDRNITRTYVEDVLEGVNNYLRHLRRKRAIVNGQAWADPELNSPDQIQQGKVYFDFDFTPHYPAEHITFRSRLTNNYLSEVLPASFDRR